MKILLIASLLLFSLTQNSLAIKYQKQVETDAYKFVIVEPTDAVSLSKVICVSKNTAQVTEIDFITKTPLALVVDFDKLFIYCADETIFAFDLVSHKLNRNPLVIEGIDVTSLEILDGVVYALTEKPSLQVYDFETRKMLEVALQSGVDHKIMVKEDVLLLNNQVLELADLMGNISDSDDSKEDGFIDNTSTPTFGCAATLSTSTTSTTVSEPSLTEPVGCAATLATTTTSTTCSLPGDTQASGDVDVLLGDLSDFTMINATTSPADITTSTTATSSKPTQDKKTKKAEKKAKKNAKQEKKAKKKAAKVVATLSALTEAASATTSSASAATATTSAVPVAKKDKPKKDKKKKKAKKAKVQGVAVKKQTVKKDDAETTKTTTYVVVATGKIV